MVNKHNLKFVGYDMNDIAKNFSQRKFFLTSVTLAVTFIALFAGKLTGAETVSLATIALGIFTGGNVAAKHKNFTESA